MVGRGLDVLILLKVVVNVVLSLYISRNDSYGRFRLFSKMKKTDRQPTSKGKKDHKLCRAIEALIHEFVVENPEIDGNGRLIFLERHVKTLISAVKILQQQQELQEMEKQA